MLQLYIIQLVALFLKHDALAGDIAGVYWDPWANHTKIYPVSTYSRSSFLADYTRSFGLCKSQYDTWSRESLSFSSATSFQSIQTASFRPTPECCGYLAERILSDRSTVQSNWVVAWQWASRFGTVAVTSTTTYIPTPVAIPSWTSCMSARAASGSIWTWVDGYPRLSASGRCPGPEVTTMLSSRVVSESFIPNVTSPATLPLPCMSMSSLQCDQCHIIDESRVEIIYWPISLSFSGNSTFTVPPKETGLVTAEYKGLTLTSPTVYLHYPTLYAGRGLSVAYPDALNDFSGRALTGNSNICPSTYIGKTYSDVIIPIPLNETLSTYFFTDVSQKGSFPMAGVLETRSLNYADLPPNPVPAESWLRLCSHMQHSALRVLNDPIKNAVACATIDEGLLPYRYRVVAPRAVLYLDPAWSGCSYIEHEIYLDEFATWDPPHPLVPKPALAVPTSVAEPPLPTPPIPLFSSRTSLFNPPTATPLSLPTQAPSNNIPELQSGDPESRPKSDPGADAGLDIGAGVVGGDNKYYKAGSALDLSDPSDADDRVIAIPIGHSTYFVSHRALALPTITLVPGAPAAILQGHTVSLGIDGVVLDGISIPFVAPSDSKQPDKLQNNPVSSLHIQSGETTSSAGGPSATGGRDTTRNGVPKFNIGANVAAAITSEGSKGFVNLRAAVCRIVVSYWALRIYEHL